MNTLESHMIANPNGISDECAKLIIDDVSIPFVMTNIISPGSEYTFSFWVKSDTDGSVTAAGLTFPTTSEWTKHFATFVADASDFQLLFNTIGNYYIYHPQLEVGNVVTDWTPAPEDTGEDIVNATDDIRADMTDKNAEVLDSCKDMIDSSLGDYVKESEYSEYKQEVAAEFGLVNGQIVMDFNTTTERINNVDGELKNEIAERSKHLTFASDNAITIGGTASGIILTVDNDNGIIFSKIVESKNSETGATEINHSIILYQLHTSKTETPTGEWLEELPDSIPNDKYLWIRKLITHSDDSTSYTDSVAFGSWDGNDFYTGNIVIRVDEKAQLGNFAYIPRSDGSLSFLKVGG